MEINFKNKKNSMFTIFNFLPNKIKFPLMIIIYPGVKFIKKKNKQKKIEI